MASKSSSAAVAAMAQRASEQYLVCRRNVTAKVDEVKLLDAQISAVFQQIAALSEVPEGQEELSAEAKAAAKSVGRLEVTLAGVEGEEPVPNATITVSMDPEYEADEYETVEEVVEKKDVVVTDENGNVVEEGYLPEDDDEESPRKLKTTTKITRTIIKKRVKKEKEPEVRTVPWTAVAKSEEDDGETTTLTFPATFVFDPVQSREAVVIITVAAAEKDEEEVEPVKEVEFPISSLFQDSALDKWYSTVDEEEEEELTTITEMVEKAPEVAAQEEVTAEENESVEKNEVKETQEVKEAGKEEAVEVAEAFEEVEQKAEEAEKAENVGEAEANEDAEKAEESKPVGSRFHVKANFVMSEAEKLSISAVALSKKKQEAEAALVVLEREAASLRAKYDRLNANQRQLSTSTISKPKTNLLGGRFGAGGVPVQRKSWYQSSRERANAFLTKHQQVLVSVAMFAGSVCLFHFNGENLLA